ncbi:MAG: hypothetical protein CM15mP106_4920 [Candidatus Neomarinimicrobiota bacterium]|nr:MAG: hypothetical protein CM15mP106_4920 [Candidatus Neomarinimicrobiota bacterium]
MATICQIGCGMIGKVMALDISKKHDLYLSDLDSLLKRNQNFRSYN